MENPNSCLETSIEIDVPNLTCEICIEPMTHNSSYNIFQNKNKCAHPFCRDCIVKYIAVKVEERVPQVPCPASNCEELFDPLSCHPILPSELFEKWCDLLCESEVLSHESAYCPFADCSALILNECGENITRSDCPNCKKLMCFQCKLPWHAGFGCDETGDIIDENDILFGELVERNKWKKCPGCKYRVERNEGCQNIKCRCGILFCYTCGKVKDTCDCHIRNAVVNPVEGQMGNLGVVRTDVAVDYFSYRGFAIGMTIFLIYNCSVIVLIVELFKMKGNRVAHEFAVLILILYLYIYAFCIAGACS